jgi:cyclin A
VWTSQVNLVDRCLKKFKINRKQFQLLGCACMMVAAKFEEVYGPNVEEFVYISDQTYTAEEVGRACGLSWISSLEWLHS